MFKKSDHPQHLGIMPEGPPPLPEASWAYCLDCRWCAAKYSMDELFEELAWHQDLHWHIITVVDGPELAGIPG
jgi:hypothetical protein